LLLGLGAGCDRLGRVRECRRVSRLVNGGFDDISAAADRGTPAGFASAAAGYGALGKALRKAPYSTELGRALSEEYAATLDEIAPAVSAYGQAIESKDQHRIDDARRALLRLKKTERSMAARMDSYCVAVR
jgi:hypothetical protein